MYDLRAEVGTDLNLDPGAAEELADQFATDWRAAELDRATEALLEYTEKLTSSPHSMTIDDIDGLRSTGLSDRAIHDATQVASYFNYINRIADALGVEPENWLDSIGKPIR